MYLYFRKRHLIQENRKIVSLVVRGEEEGAEP